MEKEVIISRADTGFFLSFSCLVFKESYEYWLLILKKASQGKPTPINDISELQESANNIARDRKRYKKSKTISVTWFKIYNCIKKD